MPPQIRADDAKRPFHSSSTNHQQLPSSPAQPTNGEPRLSTVSSTSSSCQNHAYSAGALRGTNPPMHRQAACAGAGEGADAGWSG